MAAAIRAVGSFQTLRASALSAGVCSPSRVTLRPAKVSQSSSLATCSLRSDFAATKRVTSAFSSEIAGSSLLPVTSRKLGFSVGRPSLVVRAGGTSLGCTKRHASRKKRARVSGFRVRIATTNGMNVLKRRRAKGRKVLVPQSSSRSGKRA